MKIDRKALINQVLTLTRLGYSEADIAAAVGWVTDNVPADVDPVTWLPTGEQLHSKPLSAVDGLDALQAFFASKWVPTSLKGILAAKEVS